MSDMLYMWADYLNSLTLDDLLRDFEIEVAVSNLVLRVISTYDTPAFDIRMNNEIVLFCDVLDGATSYPSTLRRMNGRDGHRLYEMIDISIFEDWFRIHAL